MPDSRNDNLGPLQQDALELAGERIRYSLALPSHEPLTIKTFSVSDSVGFEFHIMGAMEPPLWPFSISQFEDHPSLLFDLQHLMLRTAIFDAPALVSCESSTVAVRG